MIMAVIIMDSSISLCVSIFMVVRGGMRGFMFFIRHCDPPSGQMFPTGIREGIGYAVRISPPVEV